VALRGEAVVLLALVLEGEEDLFGEGAGLGLELAILARESHVHLARSSSASAGFPAQSRRA